MKLRPDDDIYRFQAVWRDLRGWEIPFVARYVVWAAWAILFIPLFLLVGALTPLNVFWTLAASAGGAAAVTYFYIADRITAENTLDAVITSLISEAAAINESNNTKAAAKKAVPQVITAADFDALTFQPEPSNNPLDWFRKPHQQ